MIAPQLNASAVLSRNNVNITGDGETPVMLAHGFGCDQTMWRFLSPSLSDSHKLVQFDYTGCGKSDVSYYNRERYSDLHGYAEDLIEICEALNLESVNFVGHSVSSIIGLLAANKRPELFASIVMVCPSPCFLNIPPDYQGGFDREDLEELINLMDKNYVGWANYLAPLVMGATNGDEMVRELADSFCSTDPTYLKPFAKATFFSDHRADLKQCRIPCLILQSANDSLADVSIGEYMASLMPSAEIQVIDANGHCLHMTDPSAVAQNFHSFISQK